MFPFWRLLALTCLILLILAVPATAQDSGLEGVFIEADIGVSPAYTFNPIVAPDSTAVLITRFLFPQFLNINAATGTYSFYDPPLATGGIVDHWEIDDTGAVYTFHLREGLTWNDGDPLDAADVMYTWNAIKAGAVGELETSMNWVIDPSGRTGIRDVSAPDDYTIQVTFAAPECTLLDYVTALIPTPSHILPADLTQLNDSPEITNPTVTAGVFNFASQRPSEQVALVANPLWFDAPEGGVRPAGYILKSLPDPMVAVEQFLVGEVDVLNNPYVGGRERIRAGEAEGLFKTFSYPGNIWPFLAFNVADPAHPRNAFDEAGNPLDQGHHPIFGDVRVRQAIARAVDVDALLFVGLLGEGTRMPSFIIPSSWAFDPNLPMIPYDVDAAVALLEEAGWVDQDGDGIREAHGALYAEEGTPLRFTLTTNLSPARENMIILIQDQLKPLGIDVLFESLDFSAVADKVMGQRYDAAIMGYISSYPDNPDPTGMFAPESDVLLDGSNFTSWNHAVFNDLALQARTVPGCDTAARAAIYAEMQRIFQEEVPFIPLFVLNGMYAVNARIDGFAPYPNNLYWNVDEWEVNGS